MQSSQTPLIGLVGVCASGKTSLARHLSALGINCRHIAQEHSYVADMWQRLTHPEFLVFLKVSYANTLKRRRLDWTESEYQEQLHRLRHALAHADLIIDTDLLTEDRVCEAVLTFLHQHGHSFFPSLDK
jgi:hypothetical protein